jgi:hypothetical protein
MSRYVLIYHQPAGYLPGRDAGATAAWEIYFEKIGDHIIEPGQPVFERNVLGAVGTSTQLGGYSIIEAAGLDEAVALAQNCPTLCNGGGVQVGELAELPPEHAASRLRDRLAGA